MSNTVISAQNEQFHIDCDVIEIKYEYPQYTGDEKWIIVTDLTEEELNIKYEAQISLLRPFVILSRSFSEIRNDFIRNEKKHLMRAIRSIEPFDYDDDLLTAHHPELVTDILLQTADDEQYREVRQALSLLTPLQKQRVIKYFFENKSTYEIAEEEGCSHQAVYNSISAALKNLQEIL